VHQHMHQRMAAAMALHAIIKEGSVYPTAQRPTSTLINPHSIAAWGNCTNLCRVHSKVTLPATSLSDDKPVPEAP